jgi:hypothetical protein
MANIICMFRHKMNNEVGALTILHAFVSKTGTSDANNVIQIAKSSSDRDVTNACMEALSEIMAATMTAATLLEAIRTDLILGRTKTVPQHTMAEIKAALDRVIGGNEWPIDVASTFFVLQNA